MNIRPTSYSKAQTAEQITKHITAYPKQICNTEQAFMHTIEFVDVKNQTGPVGSLSEYFDETNLSVYSIFTSDKRLIQVKRKKDGNFYVI